MGFAIDSSVLYIKKLKQTNKKILLFNYFPYTADALKGTLGQKSLEHAIPVYFFTNAWHDKDFPVLEYRQFTVLACELYLKLAWLTWLHQTSLTVLRC